ncbi:MAG TPA: TIGR00730 family Rossman fold protein [Burkholderiales bacterium]|nr:TIGR00730 family Rossman fold protein [Burkholderiales bacterium]
MQSVCVFCGSNIGASEVYAAAARDLAHAVAARGMRIVYGGGNVGLMGVLAEAALAAGVPVTGVIPHALLEREVGHRGLVDLRVVDSMHERKALMAELADAFVALPGGLGTYEETFEMLTWGQLGIHRKPCGILSVAGFYDSLMVFLDHAVAAGFLKPEHRDMLIVEHDPALLLERLAAHRLPDARRWINRNQS